MKNKSILIGSLIGSFFILIIMLILPVLILGSSWWWFFGTLIFLAFSWLLAGAIIMIARMSKIEGTTKKIDNKDAISKEIESIKEDENNPDNLEPRDTWRRNIGAEGHEKTPILVIDGRGTELNQRRISIINLNDPKNPTRLTNPPEDELVEAIRFIAEVPSPEPIKENVNEFFKQGIMQTTRTIPSPSKQKEKDEEAKIEEKLNI